MAALAALLAAVFVWGLGRLSRHDIAVVAEAPPPPRSRAEVVAIGEARVSRVQPPPDEILRLDEGTIRLEVTPLGPNERFRVMTADAEVEVRGTSFAVSASERALTAVHVVRGRVEVRSFRGAFAVLNAGDRWVRGTTPPEKPLAQRVPPVPGHLRSAAVSTRASRIGRAPSPTDAAAPLAATPPARAVASTGRPSHQRPEERDKRLERLSFGRAWSLLRDGDAKAAAAAFEQVQRSATGRDIEEDALYWRAVALGRAGDVDGARALFRDFIGRFRESPRVGQAEAMLGWLLLDAGYLSEAKQAFERAALDPSPHVRKTADEGLQRLAK